MSISRSLILMIVVSHMGSTAFCANEIPTASQLKELPPPRCFPEYWTDRNAFYAGLKARLSLSLMKNKKLFNRVANKARKGETQDMTIRILFDQDGNIAEASVMEAGLPRSLADQVELTIEKMWNQVSRTEKSPISVVGGRDILLQEKT